MQRGLIIAIGVSMLTVTAGPAAAQYRYADDMSKVVPSKLDVPAASRDAAVWVGPTGTGKPSYWHR